MGEAQSSTGDGVACMLLQGQGVVEPGLAVAVTQNSSCSSRPGGKCAVAVKGGVGLLRGWTSWMRVASVGLWLP